MGRGDDRDTGNDEGWEAQGAGWRGPVGWIRRGLSRLLPAEERPLVLAELDALRERSAGGGSGPGRLRYLVQLLGFAVRLRVEAVRELPRRMGGLLSDLSFTLRALLRRPAYLLAGVLTLGVGTGGVAIVYGAADWVLLRDVPGVSEPDELAWIRVESREDSWGGQSWGIMTPDLERVRERAPSLRSLEGSTELGVHFRRPAGPAPERLTASLVTPGYFRMLRMSPPVGRFFAPGDHAEHEGPPEVVIGHDLWLRHWGGSADVIGSEVEVNRRPYTVIGVAPSGFRGAELPGRSELWFTTSAFADLRPADAERGIDGTIQLWERLIGRRAPGATVAHVEADANAAMEAIRRDFAGQHHSFLAVHFVFRVYRGIGLDPWIRSQVSRTLLILGGASLALLLLATANVANLGLTRAASRRGVSAIRRALGAGTWQVARMPVLEGLVIGALGGTLGMALVYAGTAAFGEASLSPRGASLEGMALRPTVVAIAVTVALLAGALSGVIPAWTLGRERALDWLGGDRRGGRVTTRTRSILVVGQVALSGALLVAAALFGRTVMNLNAIDLGLAEDAYSFTVDPGLDTPESAATNATLEDILSRLEGRMGADGVGLVFPRPFRGWRITGSLRNPGGGDEPAGLGSTFWISGNGFFSAMGLRMVAGPGFRQDPVGAELSERPVVINQAMAESAFPGLPPGALVGRPVLIGQDEAPSRIVGVVSNARIVAPDAEAGPIIFRPYDSAWSEGSASFYLRGDLATADLAGVVREAVGAADAALPIYDAGGVRDQVNSLLVEERVVARLASTVSLIGALLVAIGLYGVLAYTVQARRREIGVRSALGASPKLIRRAVLRRGIGLVVVGLAVAVPLAWWVTRYLESRLFGVDPLDPLAFGLGVGLMLSVGLVASWLPALRATRISPVEALREE